MNRSITTLSVLLFSMLLCFKASAADWKRINDNAFVDVSHIENTKNGTVLVWVKETKTKSYINRIQDMSGKDYSLYKESISIFEIDCRNNNMIVLDVYDYDINGNIIKSSENIKIKINNPVPYSIGNLYLNKICNYIKAANTRDDKSIISR